MPVQYTGGNIIIQNGTAPSGVNDLVTGASTVGSNGDIDGGPTSIQSPPIALPQRRADADLRLLLLPPQRLLRRRFLPGQHRGPRGKRMVFEELGTALNDAATFTTRTDRPLGLRRADDPDPVQRRRRRDRSASGGGGGRREDRRGAVGRRRRGRGRAASGKRETRALGGGGHCGDSVGVQRGR